MLLVRGPAETALLTAHLCRTAVFPTESKQSELCRLLAVCFPSLHRGIFRRRQGCGLGPSLVSVGPMELGDGGVSFSRTNNKWCAIVYLSVCGGRQRYDRQKHLHQEKLSAASGRMQISKHKCDKTHEEASLFSVPWSPRCVLCKRRACFLKFLKMYFHRRCLGTFVFLYLLLFRPYAFCTCRPP